VAKQFGGRNENASKQKYYENNDQTVGASTLLLGLIQRLRPEYESSCLPSAEQGRTGRPRHPAVDE